jgi:hypothetical protein
VLALFASNPRILSFSRYLPLHGESVMESATPPLIAAQHDKGDLVLIEGHSRATAYVLERYEGTVKAFIGSSLSMKDWPFY